MSKTPRIKVRTFIRDFFSGLERLPTWAVLTPGPALVLSLGSLSLSGLLTAVVPPGSVVHPYLFALLEHVVLAALATMLAPVFLRFKANDRKASIRHSVGASLVLYVPWLVLGLLGSAALSSTWAMCAVGAAAFVWLFVAFPAFLVVPAIAAKGELSVSAVLTAAFRLTKGHRLSIVALLLAYYPLMFGAVLVTGYLSLILAFPLTALISLLCTMIFSIGLFLFVGTSVYSSLTHHKEAHSK